MSVKDIPTKQSSDKNLARVHAQDRKQLPAIQPTIIWAYHTSPIHLYLRHINTCHVRLLRTPQQNIWKTSDLCRRVQQHLRLSTNNPTQPIVSCAINVPPLAVFGKYKVAKSVRVLGAQPLNARQQDDNVKCALLMTLVRSIEYLTKAVIRTHWHNDNNDEDVFDMLALHFGGAWYVMQLRRQHIVHYRLNP